MQHLQEKFPHVHLAHSENKSSTVFCWMQIKMIMKKNLFPYILYYISKGQSYLTAVQKQNVPTNTCSL